MKRDECDVFTAGNGAEALKLMQGAPIDIIITDILMPEKEGLETIMEVGKIDKKELRKQYIKS
ncbi:MAG: response regulator [Deltaproteobacteria bacterium]|nr:response regulator [Deltaproteobacteria bacterium]